MKGHKRFRAGAWRLTVNAKDPVTGRRKPVYRTVHAPDTNRGAAKADTELAKLIAEVETGRTMPTSGLTVEQLVERYIVDKAPPDVERPHQRAGQPRPALGQRLATPCDETVGGTVDGSPPIP